MKKVILLFVTICLLFITACNSAQDELWRGDYDDMIDRTCQHTPSPTDVQKLNINMKMKNVLDIMGKAHDTEHNTGFGYNPMTLYWHIDGGGTVEAVFIFPNDMYGKDELEGLNLEEQWVNYGVLASIDALASNTTK